MTSQIADMTAGVPEMNTLETETGASELVRDAEAVLEGETYWVEYVGEEYRGHVGFEKREVPTQNVHRYFVVRDPDGKEMDVADLSQTDKLSDDEAVAEVEEFCLRVLRDYYKSL